MKALLLVSGILCFCVGVGGLLTFNPDNLGVSFLCLTIGAITSLVGATK